MNRIKLGYNVMRYLGPRIVGLRADVYLRRLLGITQRTFASRAWQEIDLERIFNPSTPHDADQYAQLKIDNPPPFLFPLGKPPRVPAALGQGTLTREPSLPTRMRLLADGRCTYFFRFASPEPTDWYINPIDGKRSDPEKPWFDLPDYLPEQGDPRMLWEPSRAAWAIDCARAYARGAEADADRIFWRWVDSWMKACPPFLGFHWKCGQESAVRLVAIVFAFWSLARDQSTSSARFVQLARLAWATGYRIDHHINYAISQKNNHAMSEACGLILIGQLFPELRQAKAWRERGREILAREIRRQVYNDGSYVQHSMNYQRVMLQMSILAVRLGEVADRPFPREIYEILDRAGQFLYQMMDTDTGHVPLYGNNDGAYVLPLSECDFQDFRPVIQATHYLAHGQRLLPRGPWDEDLLWLFGPDALAAPASPPRQPASCAFRSGGYYTLRRPLSWAMLRSHTFRDRPGQCDQLHVDLWWRGQNVLRDCGTYRYYCPHRPDEEYYFKSVLAHNTVQLDATNPLELVSRFLWFPWPRGQVTRFDPGDDSWACVEVVSHDYDRRPVRCLHRRALISLPDDLWVVVDDLLGKGAHTAVVRWHLLDAPYRVSPAHNALTLDTEKGPFGISVTGDPPTCSHFEVIRGRDKPGNIQGFAAPYYGERVPIPTLEVSWSGAWPQRIVSAFCPGRPPVVRLDSVDKSAQHWSLETSDTCHGLDLSLPHRDADPMFLGIAAGGEQRCRHELRPSTPKPTTG